MTMIETVPTADRPPNAWRFGVSHAYVFVVLISFIRDACVLLSVLVFSGVT